MNQKDSEQEVQKDIDEFNQAIYTGDKLPVDLIERFKTAIFNIPIASHKMSSETIKKIASKKNKEIINFDIPSILNTITLCPFSFLYKDFDEALKKNKEIEHLKIGFNIIVHNFNKQMDEKRNALSKVESDETPKMKSVPVQAQA